MPFGKGIASPADRETDGRPYPCLPLVLATQVPTSEGTLLRRGCLWLPLTALAALGSCRVVHRAALLGAESEDRPLGVWKVSSRTDSLSRGSCSLSLLLGVLLALWVGALMPHSLLEYVHRIVTGSSAAAQG